MPAYFGLRDLCRESHLDPEPICSPPPFVRRHIHSVLGSSGHRRAATVPHFLSDPRLPLFSLVLVRLARVSHCKPARTAAQRRHKERATCSEHVEVGVGRARVVWMTDD